MARPRETLACAASGVKALTHMIALRLADMVAGWRERRLAQGGVALAPRAGVATRVLHERHSADQRRSTAFMLLRKE